MWEKLNNVQIPTAIKANFQESKNKKPHKNFSENPYISSFYISITLPYKSHHEFNAKTSKRMTCMQGKSYTSYGETLMSDNHKKSVI